MIPKIELAQRDFSGGEMDSSAKRGDDVPAILAAGRQAANWRILATRGLKNRPGRRALFLAAGRVEEIVMSPGNTFFLAFGQHSLSVYNAAGTRVFNSVLKGDGATALPWTLATVKSISWGAYRFAIYICYGDDAPANVPQVLTWDGVSQTSPWVLTTFAEQVIGGIQKRTPFYRISPQGITMIPSDVLGVISIGFSAGVLTAQHIGTRLRYSNFQILITGVSTPTIGTGFVEEQLPQSNNVTFTLNPADQFQPGDVVIGNISQAKGIYLGRQGVTGIFQMLTRSSYVGLSEVFAGPGGSISGATAVSGGLPGAISVWDEEVMNAPLRGYPRSCFVDQGRLGFCDFPSVPAMVVWSAIGTLNDLYTDSNNVNPNNAIIEIVPGAKSRVLHVVPGAESSEFVFCDNGVYYVPITATNPLKPGSVAFNLLSKEGSSPIRPRSLQEVILYVNAGLSSVIAVLATGAYNRPFATKDLTALHSHLIKSPVALAIPSTTGTFPERYAYVLNSDGSVAVGKYEVEGGQIKGSIGWLPWNGVGSVSWIAAYNADVVFTTSYAPNGIAAVSAVEILDDANYLDAAILVNNVPAAFTPPGGKGPLWWLAGGTVDLIDVGTRMMGTYAIDANGFLVPQNVGGEDLTSVNLVAGQAWTAVYEPFIPNAQPGADQQQRSRRRKVSKVMVAVQNSSGFLFRALFSGARTNTSPAAGAPMRQRRIPAWNVDDDPTQAPPLREQSYQFRPSGRSYDPRISIVKDTPGPLTIVELGGEVTV